jgi:hypothetical protein
MPRNIVPARLSATALVRKRGDRAATVNCEPACLAAIAGRVATAANAAAPPSTDRRVMAPDFLIGASMKFPDGYDWPAPLLLIGVQVGAKCCDAK